VDVVAPRAIGWLNAETAEQLVTPRRSIRTHFPSLDSDFMYHRRVRRAMSGSSIEVIILIALGLS
jgi:hypothetical protein